MEAKEKRWASRHLDFLPLLVIESQMDFELVLASLSENCQSIPVIASGKSFVKLVELLCWNNNLIYCVKLFFRSLQIRVIDCNDFWFLWEEQ